MIGGRITKSRVVQHSKVHPLDPTIIGGCVPRVNGAKRRLQDSLRQSGIVRQINIPGGGSHKRFDASGHSIETIEVNADEDIGLIVSGYIRSGCQRKVHVVVPRKITLSLFPPKLLS